jgi:hypothetical protein
MTPMGTETDGSSNPSRRALIELLGSSFGFLLAIGSAPTCGAATVDESFITLPSTSLIRVLLERLDSRLSLGLAVSQLNLIETDYFGNVWRDRPTDLWECIETWPAEAKRKAIDLLLPMIATHESSFI